MHHLRLRVAAVGALLCALTIALHAAAALGVHTVAGGLNTYTTSAINTTGDSLIVTGQGGYANPGANGAVTDSPSNTYTTRTQYGTPTATPTVRIKYKYAPTTNASHTVTSTGATLAEAMVVAGFTGIQIGSDPYDQENGSSSGSGVTSRQAGSITPSTDGQLIVAVLGWADPVGGSNTVSINGGFTIIDQQDAVPAATQGVAMAYLVQTTAAAANPTWSWTSSVVTTAAIASFKAAAATTTAPSLHLFGVGR